MDELLEQINSLRLFEYRFQHFDGWKLLIIADQDLSYHHQVELILTGVKHISCDVEFYHQVFSNLGLCPCGCSAKRIGIEADRGCFEVVCDGVEILIGTVFHYQRPYLKPGERVAPWVK